MSDTSTVNAAIVTVGLAGEKDRGNGGAIYVNRIDNIIKYMLVDEFESEQFKDTLSDMLSEDGSLNLYVVEEIERVLHIWKIPRHHFAGMEVE